MDILFDLLATQPNVSGKRHGGARYAEIVLSRILERKLPVCCYYDSTKWLNPEIKTLLQLHKIDLYDLTKHSLLDIVNIAGVKIIYSALPKQDLKSFSYCKVIGTIHGLRGLETPLDNFSWKYNNVRFAAKIKFILQKYFPSIGYKKIRKFYDSLDANPQFSFIAVSNHTKYALYSFYPKYKGLDIPVFYSPFTLSNKERTRKCNTPYFLLVSANRWVKNNLRGIIALDRLFSAGYLNGFEVHITGAKSADNFKYTIKNPERFKFLGYVNDDELEQQFHDAYCLLYPSLNEGFGYPPMEAMHNGVPVIASSFSAIPEVCQGAAIYTDPYCIEEIMGRILLISDPIVHKKYSELGLAQSQLIRIRQEKDLDLLIDYIYSKK